ncbi:50S ribosomal protein L6 [Brumimicrobium salinarum]|uniref:Large ribosomal subunit protein uL6 n=1 Tax=Brumimicrobium salinarum TaxID=2058658 RepID=A0A2I0R3U0_9FLAO|nr:50S ribosomal protein L6 [Brumimicrobium salinarum]PKR81219.1 50S ribosomal protein L6 [Brumimicrobium salinarum]
MSRIGKSPINIPSGVEVKMDGNLITVKGAKGELTQELDPAISVKIEEDTITFDRESNAPVHRGKHGLYRALVFNMIEGVTEGYKKVLEIIGVGFRATAQGQILTLSVGHSHPIVIELPKEIKVSAETAKGKAPIVTLESVDKQLVGQVAAKIRSFRKPEPYKGKGIRLQGEYVRRKAGKAAGK